MSEITDTPIAIGDKIRAKKIGQIRVKRYWPGKAPDWADKIDEHDDINTTLVKSSHDCVDITRKDDPRLIRLSRVDNLDQLREDHKRMRHDEIVSSIEDEVSEKDDNALDEMRMRVKERVSCEQDEIIRFPDEDDEEEDEFESESDLEEEVKVVNKEVFVVKSKRGTISEREELVAKERAFKEAEIKRNEELRKETKESVVRMINEDREIHDAATADVDMDGESNEEEEYEAWKCREIARVKKDREVIQEKKKKVGNIMENLKPRARSKRKWRFMQRYYHKGAFFQTGADDDRGGSDGDDDIYGRDYSAPTGEDKMDKAVLPKVMQVKGFGRVGRTKWTHLVNEDTTDWSSLQRGWTYRDSLRAKYDQKMAGIEKPKGSKKLKDWEQCSTSWNTKSQ